MWVLDGNKCRVFRVEILNKRMEGNGKAHNLDTSLDEVYFALQ